MVLKIEMFSSISTFSKENCKKLTHIQRKRFKKIWEKKLHEIDFDKSFSESEIKIQINSITNCAIPALEKSLNNFYQDSYDTFSGYREQLNLKNVIIQNRNSNPHEEDNNNQFLESYTKLVNEIEKSTVNYKEILDFFESGDLNDQDDNISIDDEKDEEFGDQTKHLIISNLILLNNRNSKFKIRDINHICFAEIINKFFEDKSLRETFDETNISTAKKLSMFMASLLVDQTFSQIVYATQKTMTVFDLDQENAIKHLSLLNFYVDGLELLENHTLKRIS